MSIPVSPDLSPSLSAQPQTTYAGTEGADTLYGAPGVDILAGLGGADLVYGDGSETFLGGGGDDWISVSPVGFAHIVVDGGEGVDQLHVSLDAAPSASLGHIFSLSGVELLTAEVSPEDRAAATLVNAHGLDMPVHLFESTDPGARGSGPVTFIGGQAGDSLVGGLGADRLSGRAGDDVMVSFGGDDTVKGGAGDDHIEDGGGADTLSGGRGDDQIVHSDRGQSTLLGGQGHDTLYEFGAGSHVLSGGRGDDSLIARYIGENGRNPLADGADLMFGGRGDDTLDSAGGADTLHGGAGADTLIGGAGADILDGGAGADVFIFTALSDSTNAAPDWVTLSRLDVIDLHQIDADLTRSGDQAFHLVSDFTGHAGELTLHVQGDHTLLRGDVDGDGGADFTILLHGDQHAFTGFVF